MTTPIIRVGVQTIVCQKNSILLGKRKNVFQSGTWGLPGGHLELNENLVMAGARELYEETNLVATQIRLFCVTDPDPASNYHMQIGLEVLDYEGVPILKEPDRCSELGFFELDKLPKPIFIGSKDIIHSYSEKIMYRTEFNTEDLLKFIDGAK